MINLFSTFRRYTTLDALVDKESDINTLKTFTKKQRKSLYNYLTGRAYRLNKDSLRDSALWIRNDLMKTTMGENNIIPFDRKPIKKKQSDFLPDVYNVTTDK